MFVYLLNHANLANSKFIQSTSLSLEPVSEYRLSSGPWIGTNLEYTVKSFHTRCLDDGSHLSVSTGTPTDPAVQLKGDAAVRAGPGRAGPDRAPRPPPFTAHSMRTGENGINLPQLEPGSQNGIPPAIGIE